MSFADNLKQIRKEHNLSQEEMAELLNVSRQAVSKWEQGVGYPEVEKLLELSSKLDISLDQLMDVKAGAQDTISDVSEVDKITLTSQHQNVVANCFKVFPSQIMLGGKNGPSYALIGVSKNQSVWSGESKILLGWYADKEQIEKEINEIKSSVQKKINTYELKYNVKVEQHGLSIKIVDE